MSDYNDSVLSARGRGRGARGRGRGATQAVGNANGNVGFGRRRAREMDTSEESLAERRVLRPRLGSAS